MASVLNGSLSQKELENTAANAKEFAYLNGVMMRTEQAPDSVDSVQYAPFTLFPSLVPAHLLKEVQSVQKDFNHLMHKVAHDKDFLFRCFQNVLPVDDFTKNLWDIYCKVLEEGVAQPISFGLFRNDYMMDVKGSSSKDSAVPEQIKMKQIEFNTFAASFSGLVSQLSGVHRYSLAQVGKKYDNSQIPDNDPAQGFADALIKAWEIYSNKSAVIVFLVSEHERNRFDQRWLDAKIFKRNNSVFVLYRTMKDMVERSQLHVDKSLWIDDVEVAVVYFRTGYSPDNYRSQKDWDIRLQIERSKALKCPTVHYQLAGAKKVQQELCHKGAVEKYITDKKSADKIRDKFVEQFSLDLDADGNEAASKGISEPPFSYVLKPNREGGGNNIYGTDVKEFLINMKDSRERSGYIMMERIWPWTQRNCLLKVGQETAICDVVSEIGIYGVYIGSEEKEIENSEVGFLLRTKRLGTDEGGIVKGFSCLDTPFLIH